jgi:hypothetical protein
VEKYYNADALPMSEEHPIPPDDQSAPVEPLIPASDPLASPDDQPTPPPQQMPLEVPRAPEGQPDYSQAPQYFRPYPNQPPSAIDRLIPTKNAKALIAYYLGVFSVIPCIALVLGPAALILGILGLKECKRDPNLPGKGHAITGIVLGSLTFVANAAIAGIAIWAAYNQPHQ